MSDAEINAWVFMGVSLMIGVSIFLFVKWNDRKYRNHHHQK
jgi:hypothetical protein